MVKNSKQADWLKYGGKCGDCEHGTLYLTEHRINGEVQRWKGRAYCDIMEKEVGFWDDLESDTVLGCAEFQEKGKK